MANREEAVTLLDQLESLMVKVEADKEITHMDWVALSRCVWFLLKEYAVEHKKH